MSFRLVQRVFDSDLPLPLRMTALVMAWHANKETFETFPAVERIAKEANRSVRSIQRDIQQLLERGVLVQVSDGRGGCRRPTRYTMPVDALRPGKGDTQVAGLTTEERVTPEAERVSPEARKGDRALAEKGDTHVSPDREVHVQEPVEREEPACSSPASSMLLDRYSDLYKRATGTEPEFDRGTRADLQRIAEAFGGVDGACLALEALFADDGAAKQGFPLRWLLTQTNQWRAKVNLRLQAMPSETVEREDWREDCEKAGHQGVCLNLTECLQRSRDEAGTRWKARLPVLV